MQCVNILRSIFFFFQDYKDAGRDFSKVHLKGFSEDKKLFYKKSC